jgi:hypothetical protein
LSTMGKLITGTSSFEPKNRLDSPNKPMESLIAVKLHETSLECMKAVPHAVCSTRTSEILLDSTLNFCCPNEMLSANPAHTDLRRPEMIPNFNDLPNIRILIHTSARKQFDSIMVKHELHQQCIKHSLCSLHECLILAIQDLRLLGRGDAKYQYIASHYLFDSSVTQVIGPKFAHAKRRSVNAPEVWREFNLPSHIFRYTRVLHCQAGKFLIMTYFKRH